MASRRAIALLILLVIVAVSILVPLFIAQTTTSSSSSGAVQLQLAVSPNGVPSSGTWVVTSSLFYAENQTRIDVPASIKMTATLSDGTKTVQIKNATSDQASFSVPTGTVAVQFQGSYEGFVGTLTASTQRVVPESQGETQASQAITAGFSLAAAAWIARGTRSSTGSKVLVALPGVILGAFAAAYLAESYSQWYGSGWIPAAWYGIPIFALAIASYVVSGLSAGISGATGGGDSTG